MTKTNSKTTKATKTSTKAAPKAKREGRVLKDAPKAKKVKPVVMIKSGDTVTINEAVGVHFSADPKTAPKQDQQITLELHGEQIPLVVKHTKLKTNGSMLVMSFVIKGSGAYAMLEENKGKSAVVRW